MPDEQPDRAAAAAAALAKAKAAARARGTVRPGAAQNHLLQKKPSAGAQPGAGLPAGRVRRDDPAPLNAAISGLVSEAGWELDVAAGSVFGRWAQIVGPDLAAHTCPAALKDGELIVTADSTAWATQLRLLASELVRRLNAELGDGAVLRVQVRGPGTASSSQVSGE